MHILLFSFMCFVALAAATYGPYPNRPPPIRYFRNRGAPFNRRIRPPPPGHPYWDMMRRGQEQDFMEDRREERQDRYEDFKPNYGMYGN